MFDICPCSSAGVFELAVSDEIQIRDPWPCKKLSGGKSPTSPHSLRIPGIGGDSGREGNGDELKKVKKCQR